MWATRPVPVLRVAPLAGPAEAYLYGTSISTVREVAATGKLCVMGVDEAGVASLQVNLLAVAQQGSLEHVCTDLCNARLQSNKRIDGLYVYVAPPSMEELEQRIRGRWGGPAGQLLAHRHSLPADMHHLPWLQTAGSPLYHCQAP
jgi:hypothetical protein